MGRGGEGDEAKRAQLAGPGMGNYDALKQSLPDNYASLLDRKQTQQALFLAKRLIEEGLQRELNLMPVQVPLLVTEESGLNDTLDRDGARTPVAFTIQNDEPEHAVHAQIVQAVTKWKRKALLEYGLTNPGEGLITDMRAVRKDYWLDIDHSSYVDQWDWEVTITDEQRNLDTLVSVVKKIYRVLKDTEREVHGQFPQLNDPRYPDLPDDIKFIHAEDLLKMFPDLPRKERETAILKQEKAVFLYGIGWVLDNGVPHEMRAADYDDWSTEVEHGGQKYHGLNGDILVWNPVTNRRHELSSMGVRVDANQLRIQMSMANPVDNWENLEYHKGILTNEYPLSIGGGIGQGRVMMLLLKKAHIGEVTVTVWPEKLHEICREKNIFALS
ncbi:Aspartate--ammonia ligase [Porphyridium purpureum]|uniref:Aspartate--ammonia ligase n=1 Tax=Porphyridium purpureum TaxID=35688 RepID=A0A5J4YZ18_PORPP|nr:Aspartate--ammonia ligase [Porphyridium purpureum]|eukprot:POR2648..scf208_2